MRIPDQFDEVWFLDFEFQAPDGSRPCPLCLVAVELRSGRRVALWADELSAHRRPPFDVGPRSLFVAFYASAEMGCFLALGWPMPVHVLDLYIEFRGFTNGLPTPSGWGLLGALVIFGLDSMSVAQKEASRALVMRGGPYTAEERDQILKYCAADVDATARLFQKMEPLLQPQAVFRGRYMKAAAMMEWSGIPVDTDTLSRLQEAWPQIQDELIRRVDAQYCVYEGTTFKQERFARWLYDHKIPWPLLDTGGLELKDDTFRDMARMYPEVNGLKELRATLYQMRLKGLAVGPDGRNRTLLSVFGSKTGRNQPSTTKFMFGPATWMRGLIRPAPGMAVAYVDYEQQEFGIAAALSGDPAMREAYLSGDPYLGFAKMVGAMPLGGTKETHPDIRERFKTTSLGVQFGMTEYGLANQLGVIHAEAREMLALHHQAFPRYWRWNDAAVDYAMLNGHIHSRYGWELHVTGQTNPRTLRNFPMQANGAEILRLACCLATERGITVCAPVHDALLVEGPADSIEEVVVETQKVMQKAGEIVLAGFPLRSDAKIVRHPGRYMDRRGERMWNIVMGLLAGSGPSSDPPQGCGGSPSNTAPPV